MAKNDNLTDFLTDVANAIREKKGTTDLINPQDFSAEIASIEGGGGGGDGAVVTEKDVNFRDYDGTILHSFTKAQFLAMTELPELPTQAGLICQGWNWSLEDAQSYVAEYGILEVGATYITDDGKTRLYLRVTDVKRALQSLRFKQTASNGVVVDWGDGSSTQTAAGTGDKTLSHSYAQPGEYVISLEVVNGALNLGHSTSGICVVGLTDDQYAAYRDSLYKVELGANVEAVWSSYAFYGCSNLERITLPKGYTAFANYIFNYCYKLKAVVFPEGFKYLNDATFSYCFGLSSVCFPKSLIRVGSNTFYSCGRIQKVVLPNSVTTIKSSAFNYCYSLTDVIIPKSVTTIESQAFGYCKALEKVIFPNTITSVGTYLFTNCAAIKTIVFPENIPSVPQRVCYECTSLQDITIQNTELIDQYAFYSCKSIRQVIIPNGVTKIVSSAFYGCSGIISVIFPNSLTDIETNAFYNCRGLTKLDFRASTSIPTLGSTAAFNNLPNDCKIIVPDDLFDTWKATTNWSSYASRFVKASEYTE